MEALYQLQRLSNVDCVPVEGARNPTIGTVSIRFRCGP